MGSSRSDQALGWQIDRVESSAMANESDSSPTGMKAVLPNDDGSPPCIVYWTGQRKLHVGVVTWCDQERRANNGVLQVPTDVKCCSECERAVAERRYPTQRG